MNENTCLIDGYCHLVNETFLFIQQYFEGVVPAGRWDEKVYEHTRRLYAGLESCLRPEAGEEAKEEAKTCLEEYLHYALEYLTRGDPWSAREGDRRRCRNTILNSVQMIANLTVCLKALTPPQKWEASPGCLVERWLALGEGWQMQSVHSGHELCEVEKLEKII